MRKWLKERGAISISTSIAATVVLSVMGFAVESFFSHEASDAKMSDSLNITEQQVAQQGATISALQTDISDIKQSQQKTYDLLLGVSKKL